MKIVIAPDSFKESLTAQQVCLAVENGLKRVWPNAEYVSIPVADGGEGTMQALIDATSGEKIQVRVKDPRGKTVEARYGLLGDHRTAVIEVAEACGLHLVPASERDTKSTSSYGVGQLIRHALDSGISRLIIGLGGSATTDGGSGMLAALGVKFLNEDGEEIEPCGASMLNVHQIVTSEFDARLAHCEIIVACDVDNPLCGDSGAAAFFGPQKGASSEDVLLLDKALYQFGQLTEKITQRSIIDSKGSGAAGGIGAAFLGYTNARLQPGIDVVLTMLDVETKMQGAHMVITGEGKLDQQTAHGKAPVGVANIAKKFDIPVVAVAGCTNDGYQVLYEHGIDAVFTCVPRAMSLSDALSEAETNLSNLSENIARTYQLALVN